MPAKKKTNVERLTGAALDHYNAVMPKGIEQVHGKQFKALTRRTDTLGNVTYITFNYGAIRTKQGIQDAHTPLGTGYEFKRVKDLVAEQEWFAEHCINLYGKPTPNAQVGKYYKIKKPRPINGGGLTLI